jgi:protein CpxP
MPSSSLARVTALLLLAAPLPVLAQSPAPMGQLPAQPVPAGSQPFPTTQPGTAQPAAASQAQTQVLAAAEQRINGLQTQLAITQAQAPQWFAFAQVMRDNAKTTDALFRQRAATAQSMDAVANMQSYAQISRAYADGTEQLATAFQALYATLSEQQRKAADTLFRQQAAQPVAKAR